MTERRREPSQRHEPSNLDAERSCLGGILIDNARFDDAASLVVKDFFRDAHRRIWKGMLVLAERGQPIDLVTLKEVMENGQNDLEESGGPAYLASLVDGVPRGTNVKYYAQIVKEKAAHRALILIGKQLVETSYESAEPPQQIIGHVEAQMTALQTGSRLGVACVPMADAIREFDEDLAKRVERQGQIDGWPTGFKLLDTYTHGWQPAQMVVIAADTSYGKSILAINVALEIAKAGGRVVYYSYEMPRRDLVWRMVSVLSSVPLSQMRWGLVKTEGEWEAIRHARAQLEQLPIEINDSSGRRMSEVRSQCRQIRAERGLAAIVIDHFQLTENDDGDNRVQQLADSSRRIQSIGVDLGVTTFTLSQLTLDPKDANREPQLGDLRECKSLGHEANIVLMLHPYKPADARSDEHAVVPFKCLIRKNRGERVGMLTLDLERDYVRFVEGVAPAKEAKSDAEPKPAKFKHWATGKT